MPTELAKQEQQLQATERTAPTVLEIISAVASDPRVDVSKLEALLNLQERVQAKEAEIEFNRAFARLQPKLPRIAKNGKIDLGRGKPLSFAKWEDIHYVITPLLTDEGFTLSFTSEPTDKGVLMTAILAHSLGHSRESKMALPADAGPGRNALQAIGSSHSYGKRYLTVGILNIVTEDGDDDGRKAVGFITDQQMESITDLLMECGGNSNPKIQSDFLKYMGAKAIHEILAPDYKKAVTALESKRRQVQK